MRKNIVIMWPILQSNHKNDKMCIIEKCVQKVIRKVKVSLIIQKVKVTKKIPIKRKKK